MIDTGAKQIPTGETPDFEPKQQQQDVDISMCMSAYIKTDSARRCTTKVGVPSELHYRVAHDMSSKNLWQLIEDTAGSSTTRKVGET